MKKLKNRRFYGGSPEPKARGRWLKVRRQRHRFALSHLRFFSFLLFTFYFLLSPAASAQQPLIASIEWEAETSAPAGYGGKPLPVAGSQVRAALLPRAGVPEQDIVVQWWLDETPLASLPQLTTVFTINSVSGASHALRARARSKKGGIEEMTVFIPVTSPEINLYALGPNSTVSAHAAGPALQISAGASASILAKAYFFPAGEVLFHWSHDGATLPGAPRLPNVLTITAPAGAPYALDQRLEATARHKRFSGIVAIKVVRLEIR